VPNTPPNNSQFREKEADIEEEEEEEAETFMPSPFTALAKMQISRARRKRAPIMKALESEEAPK
jgi:hypothetical protein